jgi:hypothetical protein
MRHFEKYSNLELADYIEGHSILDDGIPEHIREALLRFLWRDQAFVPSKRLPFVTEAKER